MTTVKIRIVNEEVQNGKNSVINEFMGIDIKKAPCYYYLK